MVEIKQSKQSFMFPHAHSQQMQKGFVQAAGFTLTYNVFSLVASHVCLIQVRSMQVQRRDKEVQAKGGD